MPFIVLPLDGEAGVLWAGVGVAGSGSGISAGDSSSNTEASGSGVLSSIALDYGIDGTTRLELL